MFRLLSSAFFFIIIEVMDISFFLFRRISSGNVIEGYLEERGEENAGRTISRDVSPNPRANRDWTIRPWVAQAGPQ